MTGRTAPSALLLVLGVVTLQLVRTGTHLRYVKPGLAPYLVATGVLLVLLGAVGVFAASRPAAHPGPRPSQVGWLLVVPVGLLVLVSPPALGSYGLEGRPTVVAPPQGALGALPPPRDGAVELTLGEYARRALFAPEGLDAARLRLVGFAVPASPREAEAHGPGFFLTRIALGCCAADGQPARVFVSTDQRPPADTWWTVEGRGTAATPTSDAPVQPDVVLRAERVTPAEVPDNPYSR